MTLTIENGILNAKTKIRGAQEDAGRAIALYNSYINKFRQDCPLAYVIGHLLIVNPELSTAPPISKNARGFLRVPANSLSKAQVSWDKLDDPTVCAYAWCYNINSAALDLHTKYAKAFTISNKSFWDTSYIKLILGDPLFYFLWERRDTTIADPYLSILTYIEQITKTRMSVSPLDLKRIAFQQCLFVSEFSKRTAIKNLSGWGTLPVLNQTDMLNTYNG
jgi:hypothetical protein